MDILPNNKIFKKLFYGIQLPSVCLLYCLNGYGAAFLLNEQNSSGLGNAYAGRTAIAEDASTNFFNPAGLVLLNRHQVVGSVAEPFASFEMSARRVTRANGLVVTQGKAKEDAGVSIPIPAFHVAGPINFAKNFYYGLSVTAPFGLKTHYSTISQARYFGTTSELKTIDVNPNIAYSINRQWSVGGGLSVQYAQAKLNSQIDTQVLAPAENINLDGRGHNTADNIGVGYNIGALYQPTNRTRIGAHFRSKIKHATEGKLKVALPQGTFGGVPALFGLVDQKALATVTLPEVLAISSFNTINSEWDVMGDITFTRWSRFKKLVIEYPETVLANTRVEEKFKDVVKVALGANYKYNNKLTLRFGGAFDDSPVTDKHRNIRIPDSDRYWLATGLKYKHNKDLTLDAGYTHIFVKSATVRESVLARPLQTIVANYDSAIDLFGAQFAYNFA